MARFNVINTSDDFNPQRGIQFTTPVQTAQVNADLAGQAIQDVSRATQANRQVTRTATDLLAAGTQSYGVRTNEGFDLSSLSAQIMQMLVEREDKRREQAGIDYLQEASDYATGVPEYYNEKGQFAVRQGINELVDRYQAQGVPLNILANGLQGMAGPLDQAMSAKAQAQARAAAEAAAALREQQLAEQSYRLMGMVGALSVPGITAERQEQLVTELATGLEVSMSKLDPIAASQLATQVYSSLGESSALSSRTREEVQARVALSADYYEKASVLYTNFRNGAIDYAAYSTQLSLLESNYPESIPKSFNFGQLPQQVASLAAQTLSLQQSTQELQEQELAEELKGYDLVSINSENAMRVAAFLVQSTGMIDGFESQIKAMTGGVVPAEVVTVISAARDYNQFIYNTNEQLWQEISSKNSALYQLQQSDLTGFLSMYRTLEGMNPQSRDPQLFDSFSAVRDQLMLQTGVSPEELVTMPPEQLEQVRQQYESVRDRVLLSKQAEITDARSRYYTAGQRFYQAGLVTIDPTTQKYVQVQQTQESPLPGIITELNTLVQQRRATPPGLGGLPPNFSIPQLHTQRDAGGNPVVFPLRPQDTNFNFTQGQMFGAARDGGSRSHKGLDFAVPIGTEVISYVSGTVVGVRERGGYGKTVQVKADDGTYHFFAHLDGYNVRAGQRVAPGQVLAYTGDTGVGTGPHLHWEVTTQAESGHIDPIQYARQIPQNLRQWRGSGGNPVSYDGTVPLNNGTYVTSDANAFAEVNRGAVAASDYTVTSPLRAMFASNRLSDYRDQVPTHNYGYKALTNTAYARTLHAVSRETNIPAQWIADLIAVETDNKWSPTIRSSSGAVGLIQFTRVAAEDLNTTVEAISKMTVVQQLHLAQRYLQRVIDYAGPIETPTELVVGVLHGMGALREYKANPSAYDWDHTESGLSLREYMNKLGTYVGRSYDHLRRRIVTHTQYVAGCPVCEQGSRGGWFAPHEV